MGTHQLPDGSQLFIEEIDVPNRLYNASGDSTDTYDESTGGVVGTFIKTELGRVDNVQVSVGDQDSALGVSGNGVQVSSATPAEPGDYDGADADFIGGTILIELFDIDGSNSAVSGGTDLSGSDLTLNVTAVRE